METKTITLSEKEGKRFELHLYNESKMDFNEHSDYLAKIMGSIIHNRHLLSGSVEDFLQLPNKEAIAEMVIEKKIIYTLLGSDCSYMNGKMHCATPLGALLSAIGDYKYIIITLTEI